MQNYASRIYNLNQRINPEGLQLDDTSIRELKNIPTNNQALQYIRRAMAAVPDSYTQNSIKAGDKVREQLNGKLNSVTFKYQGSVMSNTHIMSHSDIDLVTITEKFFSYNPSKVKEEIDKNPPATALNRLKQVYEGDSYKSSKEDLFQLRKDCEEILTGAYKEVDISKGKSIEVKVTSPKRKVDVVVANWYKSIVSIKDQNDNYKAIKVFDKVKGESLPPDYPFLRIHLINSRDSYVNGRLKK